MKIRVRKYDNCSEYEMCRVDLWNSPDICDPIHSGVTIRKYEPIYMRGTISNHHTSLPKHYDDKAFARGDTTGYVNIPASYKREWYRSYMNDKKCIMCGESTTCCLAHHHIDPSNKKSNVSKMVDDKTVTISSIIEEINKCKIVCLNCHQKIHNGLINLR